MSADSVDVIVAAAGCAKIRYRYHLVRAEAGMGDWGTEPWENDEAADWYHRFWTQGFHILIDEIRLFDPCQQRYDSVRAASYILQTLGIPYTWPSKHNAALKPLLNDAISILTNMVHPPSDDWVFLDMWSNNPDLIKSVEYQIEALRARLRELV